MRAVVHAALVVTALVTFVATNAEANNTTTKLSDLATLPAAAPVRATGPAAVAVAGITLKSRDAYGATKYHELTSAVGRGYCFATEDGGMRWSSTYGIGSKSPIEEINLHRLVEKDGKASLERTRIVIDPGTGTVTPKGRSSVDLHEVTRGPDGVVVWAYRDGRDVVVLAVRAERGMEASKVTKDDDTTFPFVNSDGCSFAGARIDARKPENGAFAQLSGSLPAKGSGKEKVIPRFTVDASLTKMSREPEPLLSVRLRVKE